MKRMAHGDRVRDPILHVETALGIVNIRVQIYDFGGRRVESIEFVPNRYAGEPTVVVDGYHNSRFVELLPTDEYAPGEVVVLRYGDGRTKFKVWAQDGANLKINHVGDENAGHAVNVKVWEVERV